MEIGSMELNGLSGHAAGRALLEQMYSRYIGGRMPQIEKTERGKPYFADGSVEFSISHTGKRVFCVLSHQPVGIDAEETDRQIDLRLAEKILSPEERLRYEEQPDKRLALLKLWVLKEAAAKCSGEGLRGFPNKTNFSPEDSRIQIIDNCFVAVITDVDEQKERR